RPAIKNRLRWTFGGLYPRAWSEASTGRDRWRACAVVPLESGSDATIEVQVRFLHVIDRTLFASRSGRFNAVTSLEIDGVPYYHAQECCERRIDFVCSPASLAERPETHHFTFGVSDTEQLLCDSAGAAAGKYLWRQSEVLGSIEIAASC